MKTTESDSHYEALEKMSVKELLSKINAEDEKVARAVGGVLTQIEKLVSAIVPRMKSGGFISAPVRAAGWASWMPVSARQPSACLTGS
jgi:N-acetylmuramic acid 6-phosphate (MurNAc-6-P) etherase